MAQVPKAHGEQHGAAMGARAEAARFAAAPGPAPAAAGTATGHQDGPPGQGQAPTAEVAGARTVHQDGAPGPAPTPTGTPAVPPQDAGARAGWLASVRVGVGWAVVVRVAALLVATGSRWMLQEGSRGSRPLGDALGVWYRWDAINLAQIARHGYLSDTPDPAYPAHQTAFFPGFPLAFRAVGWLVGDLRLAGLLVSAVASVVAFTMLHRLAERRLPGSGRLAVPLLACSPAGVFLIAGYTEALFLAGAITAWYLAVSGRWWWTALPAGVAVATRTVGIALVAGLAVEYLAQRRFHPGRIRADVLGPVLALVPLGAWMAWLADRTGNPVFFADDQRAGWGRQLTGPVEALRTTLRGVYGQADTTWVFTWRLELVGAAIGLALLAWCLLRADWGWAAYVGLTMAAYLLSTWYFSIPRGLLGLFPLPLLLAKALRGRHQAFAVVLATSSMLCGLGVAVFVRGPWVG